LRINREEKSKQITQEEKKRKAMNWRIEIMRMEKKILKVN